MQWALFAPSPSATQRQLLARSISHGFSISIFAAQRLPRSFWGTFGEVYRKEAFTGDGETFGIDLSPGSEVSYWRVFYSHPDFRRR